MNLKPCPFCGGLARFHQDVEECPNGCHNILCLGCGAFIDLSTYADPNDQCETLPELRAAITEKWNARFQSDAGTKHE